MNESSDDTARPEPDWRHWSAILEQYAAATGLVVSLYDVELQRRAGPLVNSPLAKVLANVGMWAAGGPGAAFERDLAARCFASDGLEHATFCGELNVRALPVTLHGQHCAAVVFGWVFCSFPTSLASDRIARSLGVSLAQLGAEVRLARPVSPTRLSVLCDLLQTMVASAVYHAETIAELQTLSRARELFLAQVSHDLRTPLSSISLRIEALLLSALDDPLFIRKVLEGMQVSVRDEAKLIEDLIDSARTRTGHFSLQYDSAQLSDIVAASLDAMRPQAESKSIRLEVFDSDDPQTTPIWADAQRLKQAFTNLLLNAVKFTAREGAVSVAMAVTSTEYIVTIADSGAGISSDLLPKIFEPFVKQVQNNRSGLGLGLLITKRIVEAHGGRIHAFSAGIGHGATFSVALPRTPPADLLGCAESAGSP